MKQNSIIQNTRKLLVLILIFLILYGFYEQNFLTKKIIKEKIIELVEASLAGNLEVIETQLSKNAFDLGGGLDDDGRINFEKHKEEATKHVNSKEFKEKTKNLTPENTLMMNELKVYNYQEIMQNKSLQIEKYGFQIISEDYLATIPPSENSYFEKGIFAYYRKENKDWKIIATD